MAVRDVLAIVIFLFSFGFINMFTFMLTTELVQGYNETGIMTDQMTTTGQAFINGLKFYDMIMVLMMVVLLISVGVISRRVASAPVYFIIMFFMAAFLGFISYFFNVLFINMVSDSVFAVAVAAFPRTMIICTNLHWVALAAIVIASISLYGKQEKGQYLS